MDSLESAVNEVSQLAEKVEETLDKVISWIDQNGFEISTDGNVITATDLNPCSGFRSFRLAINTSGLTLIKRDLVPEEIDFGDYLCGGSNCFMLYKTNGKIFK